MTKQETFKRRIRSRMEKTGERYAAARRALITEPPPTDSDRIWVAPPETTDSAVRAATGRGWNEWCDVIEAWDGHHQGHAAIAEFLQKETSVGPWWAQGITVGFERITGLRLPYERPDGTFVAIKSKTVSADAAELRAMILDDERRKDLFPGLTTTMVSRPGTKVPKIGIGPGRALLSVEDKGDGKAKVAISHEKLPNFEDVEEWKFYWSEWLEAIDSSTG